MSQNTRSKRPIRVILNYYNMIGYILGLYWGTYLRVLRYILGLYWVYIGVIYWGYVGIMEKKMETTIMGYMSKWPCTLLPRPPAYGLRV